MRILRLIRNPSYQHYSPLIMGCIAAFTLSLGMALMLNPGGINIPNGFWYVGILVMIIGVALEFLSRRVLWIRIYQATTVLIIAIVYAGLLWAMLAHNQTWENQLFSGLLTGFILVISILATYRMRINSPDLAAMPHGTRGILNTKTGFVDPTASPVWMQERWDKAEHKTNAIKQISPLIAGISMFLVQVLSKDEITIMLAIVALMAVILFSLGAGGFMAYIASVIRWERSHNRRIYVRI